MIGTNDIKDVGSIDECLNNCRAIINIAKQHGVPLFFRSIPPTSGSWAQFNFQTQVFSERLSLLLQEEKMPYVDHRAEWEDQWGFFAAEMSDDGLHLNQKGYEVIRRNFYPE
jgi:lysophospholipase L1-like esterase